MSESMTNEPAIQTDLFRRGRAHWGSIPVRTIQGSSTEILRQLPVFERLDVPRVGLAANPHFDLVVQQPDRPDKQPVPVGLVSKTYQLIQHAAVLTAAQEHLKRLVKKDDEFMVSADLTDTGERVMFYFDLGPDFSISPDGNPVALHLLIRNSVDGSTAIRAQLGWYRLICLNGLVVGVTLGRTRVTHNPEADLAEVFEPLVKELGTAKVEGIRLCKWAETKVSIEALGSWVDETVEKEWGVLAAARVWEICRSGHDGEFMRPFESAPARSRTLRLTTLVPGAMHPADNVYAVTQALSWVASRRNNLEDRMTRQNSIGTLIRPLLQAIQTSNKPH
jgi:hypothetical protein